MPVAGIGFAIGDRRGLPVATGGGAAATGRATATDYPGEARAFWRLVATRTNGSRQGWTDDSDSQTRRAVTLMLPAIFRRRSRRVANCARVHGFVPLNFMSDGSVRHADGNVMADRTISDASARSNVFLVGVNAAF